MAFGLVATIRIKMKILSSVHVTALTNTYYQNREASVIDRRDDSVVAARYYQTLSNSGP